MRMFLFLLLVQFVSTASASRTDSILTILDSELGKKMEYRMEKEKQISTLKQSLFVASSVYEQYFICDKLYNEYSSSTVLTSLILPMSMRKNQLKRRSY